MIRTITQGRLRTAVSRSVAALPLVLTGCLFGGGGPEGVSPQATASADSARVAAVNQRILAAAPGAGATTPPSWDGYKVGPQDRILVDVFGAETFTGEYRVEDSGAISFPLLGSVEVAGLTPRELEERIASRLRDTYMRDPHVSVQVLEVQSQGISVIGAVNAPGVYQITGRSTLLQVLAMAQGLSETAGGTVHVVRPARTPGAVSAASLPGDSTGGGGLAPTGALPPGDVVEVDLGSLLEAGNTQQNVEVLPGDVVQVRPAGLVYVAGEVNAPGGFQAPAGAPMTVLQALAMAEGLGRTAKASEAVIVRESADGSRNEIPVNLDEVIEGSAPPPTLQARDVLFVPNNGTKAVTLGVLGALVSMFTFRGLFY
jgi:polysaccharide biosynthesis/export protein